MKSMQIIFGLLVVIIFTISSCSKDELEINQENLMGVWVSSTYIDTLEFVNQNSFYKNHDHFDYNLTSDSIEIRYRGILYIGVHPTNHKYSITDKVLTIDFTNKHCFGFSNTIETFEKQ
jgi:hypothetical protein